MTGPIHPIAPPLGAVSVAVPAPAVSCAGRFCGGPALSTIRGGPEASSSARESDAGPVPSRRSAGGAGLSARGLVSLCVDPGTQVGAAVEDTPPESEAGRAGAQVSPVPAGGDGRAEHLRGFGDGEQLGLVIGGGVGHGWLPGSSVVGGAFTR